MYFENNVHVEFFKEVNYFIYSCAGATIYPSFTAVEFNPNFVGVYGGDSNDDVNQLFSEFTYDVAGKTPDNSKIDCGAFDYSINSGTKSWIKKTNGSIRFRVNFSQAPPVDVSHDPNYNGNDNTFYFEATLSSWEGNGVNRVSIGLEYQLYTCDISSALNDFVDD